MMINIRSKVNRQDDRSMVMSDIDEDEDGNNGNGTYDNCLKKSVINFQLETSQLREKIIIRFVYGYNNMIKK